MMLSMRERTGNARRPRTDDGITMAELLVAMLVFGILSTLVVGFFASTVRTMSQVQALSTNTSQASNGMNESARIIRAGTDNPVKPTAANPAPKPQPAFLQAKKESLVMYAYVNLAPVAATDELFRPIMVKLSLDSKRRLIEQRWSATAAGDGYWTFPDPDRDPPAESRILAATVAPEGADSLFTYTDANGARLCVATAGAQCLPAAGLPEASRRLIAAVKVSLTIEDESGSGEQHRVTLENTVGVPNLGIGRLVS